MPSSNSRQVWNEMRGLWRDIIAEVSPTHALYLAMHMHPMYSNLSNTPPETRTTLLFRESRICYKHRELRFHPRARLLLYRRSSPPIPLCHETRFRKVPPVLFSFLFFFFKEINLFWILQSWGVSTPFPAWWVSSARFLRSSVEHPWRCRATELGRGRYELWPIIGRATSVTGAANQRSNLKWLLMYCVYELRRA